MPNSIEHNAYRILGLDTTASKKDILKRYKELINRLKIEDQPTYDLDLGLPKKLRTEETVNNALKQLQSPKNNIKEYFFWFQISDTTDEKSLEQIKNGEFTRAIQTWNNAAKNNNSTSYFYKKNTAILYCILLLNEHSSAHLKDSLAIWHELVNS